MKKHRLTALTAALCLLCTAIPITNMPGNEMTVVSAAEEKPTYGILTYSVEDGCVTITGCESTTEPVEIPTEIDGMPVTKIGATAFYGAEFTSIVIPEGVTTICSGAFWHCKQLADLTLPSTLTTIEGFAFNDCQALKTIEFPASLSYIGNAAFEATPWIAAQREKSPYVVVNGILIDAFEVINARLVELEEERNQLLEQIEQSKNWQRYSILTNQVGYFTDRTKKATLVTESTEAIAFELFDENGNSVYTGTSTPFGYDIESGDNVQILDFSDFTTEGVYTIKAATGEESKPFTIGITDLYSGMLYDSLNFFYQARSGMEIESQYITSGDAEELARAAGHTEDIAEIYQTWGYTGTSGTQDVSGGWYDAGDHGKYVVNGGISLWLMQNEYERAVANGTADAYQDGVMQLPENQNGYPDLLDEARYEMEWMLKMIVQDGDCEGMVYHKVHDIKWTALATAPSEDVQRRILMPPTTAATLNLAACGAQSYRLWKELDPEFAEQCLEAAKTAYAAAKANPEMYAPLVDTDAVGGGPYGDDNVTDEFYWAACELYAATNDSTYYDDLTSSDWALKVPSDMNGGEASGFTGSFDWGHTATLGSLTLTLFPEALTEEESQTIASNLTATADTYMDVIENQGYGLPYQGTMEEGDAFPRYTWGSNSFVVDNAIILAYAYEASANTAYLDGAVSAMDYILGRNPLDLSYVTGYGVHTSQYPHHRWWAKSLDTEYPKAPCGVLIGGPNTGLEDTVVLATDWEAGQVAPQTVYIDNIEAYSVNECAINWNSALAWLTSYLCEQNGGIAAGHASTGVQIPEIELPPEGYVEPMTITIPEGVTTIGEQIFGKNNGYVAEVIIPEGVTSISKEAFYRCTILEEITLPSTIEVIGENAFKNTPWLAEQLAESPLLIINNYLIDGTTAVGDVVIPDGVTVILGSAFKMNKNITSVTIPDSVVSIGPDAFNGCEAMTTFNLPANLETIGANAFASTPITSLTIPASVTKIEKEAFINCKSLAEVTILGKDVSIGTEAFGCLSIFTQTGQYSYVFIHQVIEDFIVNCYEDSTAEAYAISTGVQVQYLTTFGDLNEDTEVNATDAAVILVAASKIGAGMEPDLTEAQLASADINGDGTMDALDASLLLQYAAYVGSGYNMTLTEYLAEFYTGGSDSAA